MVETPAKKRSNEDPCHQFGGETQSDGHRGRSGLGLFSGLLPDIAVFPVMGKLLVEAREPCGERSFVGRRWIA